MKHIILLISVGLNTILFAQETTIINQKTLGGNSIETLGDLITLGDGTIFTFGRTISSSSGDLLTGTIGDYDGWLVKLNSDLSIAWQMNYGGTLTDYAEIIIKTNDGNFLLGFSSNSNISGNKTVNTNGDLDYWIIKIDPTGAILWQASYGGNDAEELTGIKELSDGSFILAGHSRSDISGDKTANSFGSWDYWVVKIGSTGNVIWDATFGGDSFDKLYDFELLDNNQIVLCGHSYSDISGNKTTPSYGEEDIWIVWLDNSGAFLQEKVFGGNDSELSPTLSKLSESLYISCTSLSNQSGVKSENSFGGSDYWVVKIDNIGNIIWDKTIGGNQNELIGKNTITMDNQLVVQGSSFSNVSGIKSENSQGFSDYWLVSLDTNGVFIWDKTIGAAGYDTGVGIFEKADNNYILFGYSDSNISGDKDEICRGAEDFWILEVTSTVGIKEDKILVHEIYPNPAVESFRINTFADNLDIYTTDGKLIYSVVGYNGESISVVNFTSGIYIVRLKLENNITSRRMVVK